MRRFKTSGPRYINAKFAGKCTCCGGDIPAGQLVAYVPGKGISHLGNYDGEGRYTADSAACAAVLLDKLATGYGDPGELAEDRWNETHH